MRLSVEAQPKSQTKRNNVPAIFTCVVRGYPLPFVRWKKNGQIITSTSDGRVKVSSSAEDNNTTVLISLNITAVTRGDNGTYVCEASNVVGDVKQQSSLLVLGMENLFSLNPRSLEGGGQIDTPSIFLALNCSLFVNTFFDTN